MSRKIMKWEPIPHHLRNMHPCVFVGVWMSPAWPVAKVLLYRFSGFSSSRAAIWMVTCRAWTWFPVGSQSDRAKKKIIAKQKQKSTFRFTKWHGIGQARYRILSIIATVNVAVLRLSSVSINQQSTTRQRNCRCVKHQPVSLFPTSARLPLINAPP
jgi:hypothetical protein